MKSNHCTTTTKMSGLVLFFMLFLWVVIPEPCHANEQKGDDPTQNDEVKTQNEKSEVSAPSSPAPSIPRFELVSKDRASSLRLGLVLQFQYDYTKLDLGNDETDDSDSKFRIRRLRLILSGTLLVPEFSYSLQLNTTPGCIEVVDTWMQYKIIPQAQLRFGIQKIPFTRYRLGSSTRLQFVDWAIVTPYFGAERQVGLTVHNGFGKSAFQYEVGLYGGQNWRKSHAVGLAKLSKEKLVLRSSFTDPAATDSFAPMIVAHLAYNHGDVKPKQDGDFKGGPFRFSLGASAAWNVDPEPYVDLALRIAPEFLIKAYGFSMSAAYYAAFYEQQGDMDRSKLAMTGLMAQIGYLFCPYFQLAVRFAYVGTSDTLRDDTQSRARSLIGAAEDQKQQEALQEQYEKAGMVENEMETVLGFNFYFLKRALKVRSDISWLRHVPDSGDTKDDIRWRLQGQIAF